MKVIKNLITNFSLHIQQLHIELLLIGLFLLTRLPSLGYDMFNTDVWKWKARSYDFGSGIFTFDLIKTIQKYHPGVVLMWSNAIAIKIYNFYYQLFFSSSPPDNKIETIFELHFVQKFFIVLIIGITLAFIFNGLRKLFGDIYAAFVVTLIALEPFYVGLTRVIHLEGLMSSFMLASAIWIYIWLKNRTLKLAFFLGALFTSLALLTKTSSLFMVLFFGMVSYLELWQPLQVFRSGKFNIKALLQSMLGVIKSWICVYLLWLGVVLLIFVLLWPGMWAYPQEALRALSRGIVDIGMERGHEQLYFGKLVNDPGVSFYFVVLLLKSSPYLIFGLVGYLVLLAVGRHHKMPLVNFGTKSITESNFVIYMLAFSLLYMLEIILSSKKLDRYLLPTMLGLLTIVSFFYIRLLTYFQKFLAAVKSFKLVSPYIYKCLLIIFFIPSVSLLVYLHPDYFSYYNPFFGGLRTGIYVLEPKWIIGQHAIVAYFTELKVHEAYVDFGKNESFDRLLNTNMLNTKLTVGFQEKYYTQIWPFIRRLGGWASINDITAHAKNTRYFVYPVWDDTSYQEDRFKLEFVDTIKLHNVVLYRVYKRIP